MSHVLSSVQDEELLFIDDTASSSESHQHWAVLIVDDDDEVHTVTKYALTGYSFLGKPLHIVSAYSGTEARELLQKTPHAAVVLIDVVMESNDAGLRLVEYIRNDLSNEFARLILRTGQPGQAPEFEVISKYDINDYKNKAELTNTRLLTVVTTALRSFADITELDTLRKNLEAQVRERTKELAESNAHLVAVNTEKDEILGIVAHDLKNPLNVLLNLASVYIDTVESMNAAQIQEVLTMVSTSSDKMLKLITKLLDVNALEQGKFQMNLISCAPAPIVAQTVDFMRYRSNDKNITLHYNASPEAEQIHALLDEQAFGQVMENLLSNAVKYSKHHTNVFVEVRMHTNEAKQAFVRCSVRDEGPGISAEDQTKLFGKFARLTAQPTGGEDSTGPGLAIVKKMVEAMNGKVWCESELGKGATFVVELPVQM
jgi:signal transduction histidine kinase